jgi:hypothetical protein
VPFHDDLLLLASPESEPGQDDRQCGRSNESAIKSSEIFRNAVKSAG